MQFLGFDPRSPTSKSVGHSSGTVKIKIKKVQKEMQFVGFDPRSPTSKSVGYSSGPKHFVSSVTK